MTPYDKEFIAECIERCLQDPLLFGTSLIPKRGSQAHFGVLVWDPLRTQKLELQCTIHKKELTPTNQFVDGSRKDEAPRTLHHISRVHLLVSAKYKCPQCRKPFLAHSQSLLSQLSQDVEIPIISFHKNAVTQSTLTFIGTSVTLGEHVDFILIYSTIYNAAYVVLPLPKELNQELFC